MAFAPPLRPLTGRTRTREGDFCCTRLGDKDMRYRMNVTGTPDSAGISVPAEGRKPKEDAQPSYCRCCATEMVEKTPPGDERVRSVCPNCNHIAYENPKVVVGCVPVSKDKKRVLLAKRAIPPVGKWTFPQGFLENGETAERGAAREAWEEAHAELDMNPTTLLAVYNVLPAKQIQLLYQSTLLNEDAVAPGLESQDVHMFTWEEIPWDDLAFPTIKWALEYSYQHRDTEITKPHLKYR